VGNFGDGHINVYNPNNANFIGKPRDGFGNPLAFDGSWGLLLTNNGCFSAQALPMKITASSA